MKYAELRKVIQTGDILLFSGHGTISRGIQFATNSQWSHVGMALVMEEFDFIGVFESTTLSDVPDHVFKYPVKGVQIVPLSSRMISYDGAIAWRKVNAARPFPKFDRDFMRVRKEMHGLPYEQDQLELIRAARDFGPFHENDPDLSSVFCSELVAHTFKAVGWLDDIMPSNEYTPADFANEYIAGLRDHVVVGGEVIIKEDPKSRRGEETDDETNED